MVSLLLALSKCVLIPQMRCTWHKHASPPSPLPSPQSLLMLLELPLLLLDAASITLFLLSHPSPFLRVQSALHLSSSLVLLFTPQFQSLSMTTQIPPPPLTSLSSVRVSPRASRPAATTHDLLILLAATGLPTLPSLSQHEYAKHSSPTCSHTQHTSTIHTNNVVRNKQEKGQQCMTEVHNSILTFSEA